jgi:hypothetical protein
MPPQVYFLERSRSKVGEATTDFLQADPHNVGDALVCEACGQPIGMLPWEPPLRAEIDTWGTRFGDLVFGPGDSFLVSERFKHLWEKEGLIGLHGFEPVEVVKVRHHGKRIKEAPPKYFRVWAGLSDVAIDEVRSGLQWVCPPSIRCEQCRGGGIKKGWERIVLEGEPKEDIFLARGFSGQLLVSERFKRFCEENKITNCRLIPAEQASHWF